MSYRDPYVVPSRASPVSQSKFVSSQQISRSVSALLLKTQGSQIDEPHLNDSKYNVRNSFCLSTCNRVYDDSRILSAELMQFIYFCFADI